MKPNKIVIGLTGTIASGKSTACAYFSEVYGTMTVDCDQVGHEILNFPDVQQALKSAYGSDILSDGIVDRRRLSLRALADEESKARLNQITHPVIFQEVQKKKQFFYENRTSSNIMIIEAFGLLDPLWRDETDLLVAVGCDEETRIRRIMKRQQLSEPEARMRITAQASDETYRMAADIYLDGSGDKTFLFRQCSMLMKRMMRIDEETI